MGAKKLRNPGPLGISVTGCRIFVTPISTLSHQIDPAMDSVFPEFHPGIRKYPARRDDSRPSRSIPVIVCRPPIAPKDRRRISSPGPLAASRSVTVRSRRRPVGRAVLPMPLRFRGILHFAASCLDGRAEPVPEGICRKRSLAAISAGGGPSRLGAVPLSLRSLGGVPASLFPRLGSTRPATTCRAVSQALAFRPVR